MGRWGASGYGSRCQAGPCCYMRALVGVLDKLMNGEGGIGSMGQEKVRAARQGEDLEDKLKAIVAKRRRTQFGTYGQHTRIQSRTLMHTEKQTMVSRKQTPQPRETQRPASRATSENCYACARHTAATNRQPTRQETTVTGTGAFTFASQVFRNTCKARRACLSV